MGMSTYVRLECPGDHVPKRHLGTSSDALEDHLDGDDMVKSRMRRGSHDGNVLRLMLSRENVRMNLFRRLDPRWMRM